MPHLPYMIFVFALGASVGSFLNVVVWRLPRGESLVTPPSRCPKCGTRLAWRDNVPVFGWIFLRGRCRYCQAPISVRYPIVEFVTGAMFVAYYWLFFVAHRGMSCSGAVSRLANFREHWPAYMLVMWLLSALLAESLIDAESFMIEPSIVWLTAAIAVVFHAIHDEALAPLTLSEVRPAWGALSLGASAGWLISGALWFLGALPVSFPKGEPILEVEREEVEREIREAKRRGEEAMELPPPYTPNQIRAEMGKEMLFLMPAIFLGGLMVVLTMPRMPLAGAWAQAYRHDWLRGMLGSLLGAMAGGFVVYFFRIMGTMALGKVGMGRGDADLMVAVGAVLGAGPAVIAFFVAPFFGIGYALYMLVTHRRREMPFGPWLSLGAAAVIPLHCAIVDYLRPGMEGLAETVRGMFGT